jgi:hypothetical protein
MSGIDVPPCAVLLRTPLVEDSDRDEYIELSHVVTIVLVVDRTEARQSALITWADTHVLLDSALHRSRYILPELPVISRSYTLDAVTLLIPSETEDVVCLIHVRLTDEQTNLSRDSAHLHELLRISLMHVGPNIVRIHVNTDTLDIVVTPEPPVIVIHVTLMCLITTPVEELQVVEQIDRVLTCVSIQSSRNLSQIEVDRTLPRCDERSKRSVLVRICRCCNVLSETICSALELIDVTISYMESSLKCIVKILIVLVVLLLLNIQSNIATIVSNNTNPSTELLVDELTLMLEVATNNIFIGIALNGITQSVQDVVSKGFSIALPASTSAAVAPIGSQWISSNEPALV